MFFICAFSISTKGSLPISLHHQARGAMPQASSQSSGIPFTSMAHNAANNLPRITAPLYFLVLAFRYVCTASTKTSPTAWKKESTRRKTSTPRPGRLAPMTSSPTLRVSRRTSHPRRRHFYPQLCTYNSSAVLFFMQSVCCLCFYVIFSII